MCSLRWMDTIHYVDKEEDKAQGTHSNYVALNSRGVRQMLHVDKTLVS